MAWVPHTIPEWLLPRMDTIGGGGGRIRSDDFSWALGMPKPLRMWCVDAIAASFALFPHTLFDTLTPIDVAYLVETLDTSLPITMVEHVPVDEYWRRRLADLPQRSRPVRTPEKAAELAAQSPRTRYLNELASRTVEDLEPGRDSDERPELAVFGRHVTELYAVRLRASEPNPLSSDTASVDVGAVIGRLANLRSLSLSFCLPAPGTLFYELNTADVDELGRGLQTLRHLTTLAITKSHVDATLFDTLSPYLPLCKLLKDLDLSHCQLRCAGAASVARYAGATRSLQSLVLCDNGVAADGVQSLASMSVARRSKGFSPIALNLDMNNITDTGAKYLASALASGVRPFTKLRIRTCSISEIGGMNIVESLAYDQGLHDLAIDNNTFTSKVAIALHTVMKTNLNIKNLSTLNCEFPARVAQFFTTVAYYNLHNRRNQFDYVDIESLYEEIKEEEDSVVVDKASVQTKSSVED